MKTVEAPQRIKRMSDAEIEKYVSGLSPRLKGQTFEVFGATIERPGLIRFVKAHLKGLRDGRATSRVTYKKIK